MLVYLIIYAELYLSSQTLKNLKKYNFYLARNFADSSDEIRRGFLDIRPTALTLAVTLAITKIRVNSQLRESGRRVS